jgi:hypothetical protein
MLSCPLLNTLDVVTNHDFYPGCGVEHMKACDKNNPYLFSWVETRTFGNNLIKPQLPLDACSREGLTKEQSDDICNQCKNAVKIELEETDCRIFADPPSNEDSQPPAPSSRDAYTNSGLQWKQQVPAHKSYRDRCLGIQKMFKSKKSSMQREFKERACSCLGCCDGKDNKTPDPTCFVPITYGVDSSVGVV